MISIAGAQLDIQQGGGAKSKLRIAWKNLFCPPPLNISRGEARKMCVILNHEKNYLTNNGYFGGKFLHFGAFFRLRQICVRKILNLYFRGKFYFLWAIFSLGKSKVFVLEANFVFGGFFQFGQICVWEILNIYFEGTFFYLRAFFIKGLFFLFGAFGG